MNGALWPKTQWKDIPLHTALSMTTLTVSHLSDRLRGRSENSRNTSQINIAQSCRLLRSQARSSHPVTNASILTKVSRIPADNLSR
jgi:hypothetical protein